MKMYVFLSKAKDPLVVETNLYWAKKYWGRRKIMNPKIRWEIR